jgi:pantoate--beta-alanine ligase
MKIVNNPLEMQRLSYDLRSSGQVIGLVPTMGALHEAHLALLKTAQQHSDISVVSIFVNPKQFGENEDLDTYPRPFKDDCKKAEDNGCDIIFAPSSEAMYRQNYSTYVNVEELTTKLEGKSRLGHFNGVTTVVLKLFNIVQPHIAVFGQKDAQQALVLKRMVKDLNIPVKMIIIPTVREKDGLAVSSRNLYLTEEERKDLPLIYRGLVEAMDEYNRGEQNTTKLRNHIKSIYDKTDLFKAEYIEIVDTNSLDPVETVSGKALVAVACRTKQSKTRLIDNVVLGGEL